MSADGDDVWLADTRGLTVLAADGRTAGRVADLAIGGWDDHPRVSHVIFARRRGGPRRVGWSDVTAFGADGVRLRGGAVVELGPPPAPALLLCRDVLDAQVVDVAGKRVRRVSDVRLRRTADDLRVAGVDTGWRSILRRLGLPSGGGDRAATTIDWADVHLAAGGRHELRLGTPAAALRRLSPVELSELVARLPLVRGADVLQTVDRARAAGALSAARPRLGGRLVQTLQPDTAGEIIAAMPVDDAVAALRHVETGHGAALLRLVPSARAAELRRLLALPPRTAGGLMTTDIRTAGADEPVEAIRCRLTANPPALEGLMTVFVLDADGRLAGALPPRALIAGSPPQPVYALQLDTPLMDVIDIFAVQDVLALPVVDSDDRPVGAVAIDDVLEELLVERLPQHRRRYRRARARERAPA